MHFSRNSPSMKKSFFGITIGKNDSQDSTRSLDSSSDHNDRDHHNPNQRASPSININTNPARENAGNHDSHKDNNNNNHHNSNHTNTISSITIDNNSKNNQRSHSNSPPNSAATLGMEKEAHHSMLELKRFFRPLRKNSSSHSSGNSFNKASTSTLNLTKTDPFDDEGAMAQKYGRLGKVLGSGAGGSVRLLTRPSDGVTFAVKEFRARKPNEQMKDYAKKCTAEFCIGSTLHHPNIIQTLDIMHENGHYYEVMEYCPIDFFAVVMSGKMARGEINCCFRQISEGVKYLHSMGLAHRDLKLDNCVVTKDGIIKLIDFGSAVVFRYPFEENIVRAHGVVGSDPYLAPETLTQAKYDPQPVDVWSIAIIYCCMTLKRFPWKAPKQTDPSFKLYCMEDDDPHDYAKAAKIHKELITRRREERVRREKEQKEKVEKVTEVLGQTSISADHGSDSDKREKTTENSSNEQIALPSSSHSSNDSKEAGKQVQHLSQRPQGKSTFSSAVVHHQKQVSNNHNNKDPHQHHTVHGPYRLMRLLPHAARPILSRMLSVDPKQRATLDEVFNDSWFREIQPCTIDAHGKVIHTPGHVHTKVREEDAHLEGYKDKDKQKQ